MVNHCPSALIAIVWILATRPPESGTELESSPAISTSSSPSVFRSLVTRIREVRCRWLSNLPRTAAFLLVLSSSITNTKAEIVVARTSLEESGENAKAALPVEVHPSGS